MLWLVIIVYSFLFLWCRHNYITYDYEQDMLDFEEECFEEWGDK